MPKFFITTAIDYVNAKPHVGHAFEKVLADVLARYHRLRGDDVWFTTGTDENAGKNVQAAREAGMSVQDLVDKNAERFQRLCGSLGISYDDFVRTSSFAHRSAVQAVFAKIVHSGAITKGQYEGLYCQGCESFLTEKDLVYGKCPEHGVPPTPTSETCFFFDMERYRDQIVEFAGNRVIPQSRSNEMLARLEEPLKPLCVSRPRQEWGIPSPYDADQTVYVWFDALLNYFSVSNGRFPADAHVIGKGITWFHAVVWPAMLAAAEMPMPERVVVHGYLNTKGQKISKSLGNAIDPFDLVSRYGSDAVRYALMRCPTFEDADFSEEVVRDRLNKELANKVGNLITRVTALACRSGMEPTDSNDIMNHLNLVAFEAAMEQYDVARALQYVLDFVERCNAYVDFRKVWEGDKRNDIYDLVQSVKAIVILMSLFVPDAMFRAADVMGFVCRWESLSSPLLTIRQKVPPLFERVK